MRGCYHDAMPPDAPPDLDSPPAACGKCGYAARGLSTFICPECGSDLREVGIVRPEQRGTFPWHLLSKLVLWSVGCYITMVAIMLAGHLLLAADADAIVLIVALLWSIGLGVIIWRHR